MKIKHLNCVEPFTRGTLAIDIPTKAQLLEMFTSQVRSAYMLVGATFVHPNDQYNKKTGYARAESFALTEDPKYCLLTKIEPREDRWVYHFTTLVPDARPNRHMLIGVEFGVSFYSSSENTRLEFAMFQE